jgi:hypothetical protein
MKHKNENQYIPELPGQMKIMERENKGDNCDCGQHTVLRYLGTLLCQKCWDRVAAEAPDRDDTGVDDTGTSQEGSDNQTISSQELQSHSTGIQNSSGMESIGITGDTNSSN